jgi:hypothetical protein
MFKRRGDEELSSVVYLLRRRRDKAWCVCLNVPRLRDAVFHF